MAHRAAGFCTLPYRLSTFASNGARAARRVRRSLWQRVDFPLQTASGVFVRSRLRLQAIEELDGLLGHAANPKFEGLGSGSATAAATVGACARGAAHERAAAELEARGVGPFARACHVEHAARPLDGRSIDLLAVAADTANASPATAPRWYAAVLPLPGDDLEARLALLVPDGAGACERTDGSRQAARRRHPLAAPARRPRLGPEPPHRGRRLRGRMASPTESGAELVVRGSTNNTGRGGCLLQREDRRDPPVARLRIARRALGVDLARALGRQGG
jgi:hypothetical protein